MLKINFIGLFILIFLVFTSCIKEDDLSNEQKFHKLASEIMCPVCDAQTIEGSNSQVSIDMKLKLKNLIDEEMSSNQIRNYFIDRYGADIIASPSSEGFNLLAWIMPIIIFILFISISLYTIRSMKIKSIKDKKTSENLNKYLEYVEKEILELDKKNV
ncbi:MAG: cytochrome c-type biogenesis protein CcmH [Dehalococcoidia bacterium]